MSFVRNWLPDGFRNIHSNGLCLGGILHDLQQDIYSVAFGLHSTRVSVVISEVETVKF
jgi:hypothetical protein